MLLMSSFLERASSDHPGEVPAFYCSYIRKTFCVRHLQVGTLDLDFRITSDLYLFEAFHAPTYIAGPHFAASPPKRFFAVSAFVSVLKIMAVHYHYTSAWRIRISLCGFSDWIAVDEAHVDEALLHDEAPSAPWYKMPGKSNDYAGVRKECSLSIGNR